MYNFIQHFRDYLRLREAIKMADARYEEHRDRFYVLPSQDGKLIVMNRFQFKRLKSKHYIPSNATINAVRQECFYFTPYANGQEPISPEERKARAAARADRGQDLLL